MRWTAHIDGGPMRVNHAAVGVGNKIYSFGGYCSSEEYKDWEAIPVHVLNTATLRWSLVMYKKNTAVPFQRYGHTAVAYGETVYMWGGRNNAVACDTLSCFNTKTLEWYSPNVTGIVPFAKDGHSACVIKNKMYIFGGFEYISDQYSQEVHCLNLDTMQWTFVNAKGKSPSQRDFHTAVAIGDRYMYIYGGRGDENISYTSPTSSELYCQEIYCFDTVRETWTKLNPSGPQPQGRRSHSAWFYEDCMYIFGGYNGNLKLHFNDLYRYSLKDNEWQQINANGEFPCVRRRQACVLFNNKVYLFGGTSPHSDEEHTHTNNSYNVKTEKLIDNCDLHVLDYNPTLKTLGILAVIEHKLDYSSLPSDIIYDIRITTFPNRISRPVNHAG